MPSREEAHEELHLIHQMMAANRRLVVGTWRHQLAWSALMAVAMAATWWATTAEAWSVIGPLWLAMIGTGWSVSWLLARGEAEAPVRNAATRVFTGIWIGVGGALTLLGLLGIGSGALAPVALPGVTAALMGAACLASARATEVQWLAALAVAWWLAAVPLLTAPGAWCYLALAVLLLVLHGGAALRLARDEVGRPRWTQMEALS